MTLTLFAVLACMNSAPSLAAEIKLAPSPRPTVQGSGAAMLEGRQSAPVAPKKKKVGVGAICTGKDGKRLSPQDHGYADCQVGAGHVGIGPGTVTPHISTTPEE